MKTQLALQLLVALVLVASAASQEDSNCGHCDRSTCTEIGNCPGGATLDICGCCDVCTRRLGQLCDHHNAPAAKYGTCGDFLQCRQRNDVKRFGEMSCHCVEEGSVCGSDGTTYDSPCLLLEETVTKPELTLKERGPCMAAPVIKTSPNDAIRPLGGIMVLDCEAVGYPVPTITWELLRPDGTFIKLPSDDTAIAVQVRGGPERHMVTGWVQIMEITKKTIGMYTCIAINSVGQDRSYATIKLDDKSYNINEL